MAKRNLPVMDEMEYIDYCEQTTYTEHIDYAYEEGYGETDE